MDAHFWAHAIPNILTALVHLAMLYGAYRLGRWHQRRDWTEEAYAFADAPYGLDDLDVEDGS